MSSEHEVYQRLTAIEEKLKGYRNDREDIRENRGRIRELENRDHELDHIPTHSQRLKALEEGHRELESKIGDLKNYLESRFWVMAAIAGGLLTALELAFKLLPA